VNPAVQQLTERLMHEAVPSQPRLSGKGFGDDQQVVVPAAAPGAGVPLLAPA